MPASTRQTGETAAPPPDTRHTRPGWAEIAVGLVIMAVAVYRIPPLLREHADALGLVYEPALLALPAVAALAGFTTAARARVRSWRAFGLRRASWRALLAGVGAGVVAVVLGLLVNGLLLRYLGVPIGEVQPSSTVLSLLLLGVVTPLAQELLFRGVVTTVLLRHGAVVGVLGSTLVFTLLHGVAAAVVSDAALGLVTTTVVSSAAVGLVTAELLRRTGSIWPGVVAHAVHSLAVLTLAGLA